MQAFFKRIADAQWFQTFIILVILVAGVVVGIQTYSGFAAEHHGILSLIDNIILWIFVIEIIVKMGAEGSKPWNYFKDGWNIFDFIIVAVCFLPLQDASFVAVLRLARILRVFKLVTALPKLQLIVGALLKSIPSMGYVFILMALHFYIFGCMATFFYAENDPIHFGNLQTSILSLFRAVTLEDWTDLMYINMYGSDAYGYDEAMDARLAAEGITRVSSASPVAGAMFFVTFIMTGAMIVLNLFIGVIMNGMDEMKAESEFQALASKREEDEVSLSEEVVLIENQVQELSSNLKILNERLKALSNANDK